MVRGQEFHEIIENIFQDVRGLNSGEQLQVNCPRCQERDGLLYPDGKYNLEINTAKRVFRCWKCDEPKFSGSLGRLIKTFGSYTDYEVYKSYASIFQDYDFSEDEKEFVQVKLPEEMIYFSQMDPSNADHFEAYNYIINDRQFSREIVLKYRLGFCITGKYGGRVIVPSFDQQGEVNYFVGRKYKDELRQKFMNPDVDKRRFIFNEGMVNWDSTIYLVEGPFEMLSFPVNIVPMLGKDLLEALFFKLKEMKPNVVILLDPDAFKSSVELFYQLHSIYIGEEEKVKLVKLPTEDDLDDLRKKLGHDALLNALYSARGLTIDDYFTQKLHKPYEGSGRRKSYSKYFNG
jgi:hypothetical protein